MGLVGNSIVGHLETWRRGIRVSGKKAGNLGSPPIPMKNEGEKTRFD